MKLLSTDVSRHVGLLVLRVGIGGIMAYAHGWGKISGGPEMWGQVGGAMGIFGVPASLFTAFGFMAAFSEFGASIMLAMGLLTRVAAFLLFCTMSVAFAMHMHGGDDFASAASHPLELVIVYLAILLIGPGRYAVDSLICKKCG